MDPALDPVALIHKEGVRVRIALTDAREEAERAGDIVKAGEGEIEFNPVLVGKMFVAELDGIGELVGKWVLEEKLVLEGGMLVTELL